MATLSTAAGRSVLPAPQYADLYNLFPGAGVPPAEVIPGRDVPEPYHALLVHAHHMTVTVEKYYGGPVDVAVLASRTDGDEYARKILLARRDTGAVVQFGIVRVDLGLLAAHVRDEILDGRTPLGRVLIKHNVLRQVRPTSYVRVTPNDELQSAFHIPAGTTCYGRLGVILTDGRPAIEVLEILNRV